MPHRKLEKNYSFPLKGYYEGRRIKGKHCNAADPDAKTAGETTGLKQGFNPTGTVISGLSNCIVGNLILQYMKIFET